jgi:8-oxo-dGTP pyrophosphatase MutT (NUDIX family)
MARNPWKTLSSTEVYQNPWIVVREHRVIRPDGKDGIYGVVEFQNQAVGVIAYEKGYIYLVGQFRYPLNSYSWEIPEGGCPEGEDPLAAAQRELREETGITASDWKLMGRAHLSNSVSDEEAVWFLATGLSHYEPRPEGTEELTVRRIRTEDAIKMVLTGEITDAISMLAILQFAFSRKGTEGTAD